MPATVTHAYFSNDVYDILPNQIKERISLSRIKMFGQGTDPLMFYHLFSVKPGKKIRLMQRVCHRQHTRDFFCQFIEDIKKSHLEEDSDVCSFLCGFICHYVLDSTIHPFVIYKTGNFDKHNKVTYKYNNLHLFMETYLDNHLIRKREHQNPYSFSIVKYSFDLAPFSSGLNQVIHSSFDKVYHVSNMDSIYYQALKEQLDSDEFIPITGFSPLSSFTGAQTRNNILLKNVGSKLNYSAVFINTDRGNALGLKSGDLVEVFNIEEPSLIVKAEVQLSETVEPHTLFTYYGVGNGLYRKLADKLSVASPIGLNPNHIGNLTFMPVEASAPSQDFIVKIRRAK